MELLVLCYFEILLSKIYLVDQPLSSNLLQLLDHV